MLYPVLPLFLTQELGAPRTVVGVVEGVAEATQNIVQGGSGWLADRPGRTKPVAVVGYALAALAKPTIGLATAWPSVLASRFADRLGTGIRSAPRDALIAGAAPRERRGAAFGLEGIGDNMGAVVGPLVAVALLYLVHLPLRAIFLIAFIPGLLAVALISAVPERRATASAPRPARSARPSPWTSRQPRYAPRASACTAALSVSPRSPRARWPARCGIASVLRRRSRRRPRSPSSVRCCSRSSFPRAHVPRASQSVEPREVARGLPSAYGQTSKPTGSRASRCGPTRAGQDGHRTRGVGLGPSRVARPRAIPPRREGGARGDRAHRSRRGLGRVPPPRLRAHRGEGRARRVEGLARRDRAQGRGRRVRRSPRALREARDRRARVRRAR